MRKHNRFILAAAILFLLQFLYACAGGDGQSEISPAASMAQTETPTVLLGDSPSPTQPPSDNPSALTAIPGEVVITFDYEKQSGSASNQYAVWIEDMDGNYITTLYATQWTANGGYKTRPDSIALWVEKSGLADMEKSEADAISGATPRAGTQTYSWGLTDANGDTVQPGEYKFFVEGTLRWKNRVIYSGVITISDAPATVVADAEYFYEASDRQAALTSDSPENAMIGAVTANFVPAAKN